MHTLSLTAELVEVPGMIDYCLLFRYNNTQIGSKDDVLSYLKDHPEIDNIVCSNNTKYVLDKAQQLYILLLQELPGTISAVMFRKDAVDHKMIGAFVTALQGTNVTCLECEGKKIDQATADIISAALPKTKITALTLNFGTNKGQAAIRKQIDESLKQIKYLDVSESVVAAESKAVFQHTTYIGTASSLAREKDQEEVRKKTLKAQQEKALREAGKSAAKDNAPQQKVLTIADDTSDLHNLIAPVNAHHGDVPQDLQALKDNVLSGVKLDDMLSVTKRDDILTLQACLLDIIPTKTHEFWHKVSELREVVAPIVQSHLEKVLYYLDLQYGPTYVKGRLEAAHANLLQESERAPPESALAKVVEYHKYLQEINPNICYEYSVYDGDLLIAMGSRMSHDID